MSYRVLWQPSAERDLADLWTGPADRSEVARAADALDAAMARDPLTLGESRNGPDRIAFEPPLALFFEVGIRARAVLVSSVWRWPEAKSG